MSLERPPIPLRFSRTHTIGADICSEVQEFSPAAADQSPTTKRYALASYNVVSCALNLYLLRNTVSIFKGGTILIGRNLVTENLVLVPLCFTIRIIDVLIAGRSSDPQSVHSRFADDFGVAVFLAILVPELIFVR